MSRPPWIVLVGMIGGLIGGGCNGETPAAPTSVIASESGLAGLPLQGATVSGKVYDTGLRPLAGAMVEVLDGAQAGMVVITEADGGFGFTGVFDDSTRFRASKDGHEAGVAKRGPYCERCNPHYWVYFFLALPVPPADLVGEYSLTVLADEACTMLPVEARTRRYITKIAAHHTQPTGANTIFQGIASGASLVGGLGWEGLWFYVAGDYVEMSMGDLHGQPGILERVDANRYIAIGGLGSIALGSAPVSTLSMTFGGDVVYCELRAGIPAVDTNQRFVCGADQAVSRQACSSYRHRLVLAPR